VLSSPTASDQDQLDALKFLGHWVGDVHQPLHVSFEDDRGGNGVKVSGVLCGGKLHGVWDSCTRTRRPFGIGWRIRWRPVGRASEIGARDQHGQWVLKRHQPRARAPSGNEPARCQWFSRRHRPQRGAGKARIQPQGLASRINLR
jgi:S1/P1 Nuclease